MLQKLSTFLLRIANWKTFLLGLALYMLFGAFIMPSGAKAFNQINGQKVAIFDLQVTGYSPADAKAILDKYTDEGRAFAVKFGLVADTFYPMAYTFFFLIITSLIAKGLANNGVRTGLWHLFPLTVLLADYCENIFIVQVIQSYPNLSEGMVHTASFLTCFKWGLIGVLLLLVVVGLVVLGVKRFSRKD
jgi:hypothetical protein